MSDNLNINAIDLNAFLKPVIWNGSAPVSDAANTGGGSSAYNVSISKEAMLKYENFRKGFVSDHNSPSSPTDAAVANDPCWKNHIEMMRIDEPETYARYMELRYKGNSVAVEGGMYVVRPTEESWLYSAEADTVLRDWFNRRCFNANGNLCNPNAGKSSVYQKLEDTYMGVKFDVYSDHYSGSDASRLSRYSFNVLMSVDMVNKLAKADNPASMSKEDADSVREISEKIKKSVIGMRAVAGKCEGDYLKRLRFGVKLWDDGSVTYHADYNWNEDSTWNAEGEGVTANSAEELMDILTEKEALRKGWLENVRSKEMEMALHKRSILDGVAEKIRRDMFGASASEDEH